MRGHLCPFPVAEWYMETVQPRWHLQCELWRWRWHRRLLLLARFLRRNANLAGGFAGRCLVFSFCLVMSTDLPSMDHLGPFHPDFSLLTQLQGPSLCIFGHAREKKNQSKPRSLKGLDNLDCVLVHALFRLPNAGTYRTLHNSFNGTNTVLRPRESREGEGRKKKWQQTKKSYRMKQSWRHASM